MSHHLNPAPPPKLGIPGTASRLRVPPAVTVPAKVALAVAVAALAAFGGLVDGVTEHADLASYDPGVTAWVSTVRLPGLTFVFELATTVGSEVSIGVLSALTLVWLLVVRRDRHRSFLFAASMGVAAVLTVGIKHLLGRHRPADAFVVGPVDTGYSFPSGHTLFSTVFLGALVMLVAWPAVGRRGRIMAVIAWFLASASIGASRVYLGYHWVTDVLASWALALMVLGLAVAVLTTVKGFRPESSSRVPAAGSTT